MKISDRKFKTKQSDPGYWELQNKPKFIKIGSKEAEIALRVGKISSWRADLRSIFGGSIHERILN